MAGESYAAGGIRTTVAATRAATDAELLVLATEWQEYREVDPKTLAGVVKNALVIDGRNSLPHARWTGAGWRLIALGRNLEAQL